MTSGDKTFLAVAGAVLGAGVAAALPAAANWVESRGAPFPGPLQILASFDSDWLVWGRPIIGLLIGLIAALAIAGNEPVLHLTRNNVRVEKGKDRRRIARADVAGVFREGRNLVIETPQGRRLYEGGVEGKRDVVRAAFTDRGWPWEGES